MTLFSSNVPLHFNSIIMESHIDMNATTSTSITKLIILYNYIETIGHHIKRIIGYVYLLVNPLRDRGTVTSDLLTNVFKVCLICSDNEFIKYIKHKK